MENKNEISIYGSRYLIGMPCFDYKININGVSIGLSKECFAELIAKISDKLKEDYDKAIAVKNEYDKEVDEVCKIRSELMNLFFSHTDEGSIYFMKEISEIDRDKLREILGKHNKFWGFE